MTTDHKRQANRRNATRSTGPRTSAGKARSSQNARKHGLSISVQVQPHLADLVQDLATRLDAEATSSHAPEEVQALATAMLEVLRVRSVRTQILEELAAHCTDLSVAGSAASRKEIANLLQHLVRADRYERRALSRRKFLIRSFSEITSRTWRSTELKIQPMCSDPGNAPVPTPL
jgi:hypothetical protein